jgi:hypothetical protein
MSEKQEQQQELTPEQITAEALKAEQEAADKDKKPTLDPTDPAVQALIDEQLKEIKKKLDASYAVRDDALRKIAEREAKEQADLKKRLEEEGKFKELAAMEVAEERAKREVAEKRVVELTRDVELKSALSTHQFRSDAAAEMAFKTIAESLVQNDGSWIHPSGANIRDYVIAFSQDEKYSFLFKAKTNSGGDLGANPGGKPPTGDKSLFSMSQEEVLKLAASGKLGPIGPQF